MWKLLVVLGFSVLVLVSAEPETQCVGAGCQLNGLQIITKFVRQYLENQPEDITLGDGVHLVNSGDKNAESTARAADDGSLLSALEGFFKTHELRIRLPELMPDSDNIGRKFREIMEDMNKNDLEESEGRKGGGGGKKGGRGGMMLVALMMGKMMATIGFGAVGLLAMKALMVSALALMLSMIIGIKKLVSSGHDEGGHTVIHASASGHEHRRKREAADMAYHAWTQYLKQ